MKLAALRDLYLLSVEWKNLKPSSKRIYEQALGYADEFMDMDADKITRPMLLDYRDRTYGQKARCRLGLMIIFNLMQFGWDRGYCSNNPARGIRHLPPKVGHPKWDMDEVGRVLAIADQKIKDAIYLALYTGQRRSDLIRMRWDNYDGTYIHLIQQKTAKPLAIPVHPVLKKELERMRQDGGDYILTTKTGLKWVGDYLGTALSRVAREAGVEKSIHGIRKTTASVLAESGCTPFEIAAITGQSLREVMNYTKTADQKAMARKALERWELQYST